MKTNQIIKRQMGDFNVFQRTEDGMFDATALMRQWNAVNGNAKKDISKFLNKESTQEYMDAILQELNPISLNSEMEGNQRLMLTKTIRGRAKSGGGRTPDTVWMHPLLFIEFAGYFNPRFRVKVNKFILDNLIELRDKLGDDYSVFSAAGAKIGCRTPEDFKILARCLNCAVLGKDRQREQRNELTLDEAKEMADLQEKFIFLVKDDFITDISGMKRFFRKRWEEKFLADIPFMEIG